MAAAAPPPRPPTEGSSKGPGALEVLDEAVSLIRQAPLAVLSAYYLGALPFSLGLIYFWFDMTQGADAESHLAAEALALTGLYIWMKTGQAIFARRLVALLEGRDEEPWGARRLAQTALIQGIYAGTFLVVYPVAFVAAFPFGWVHAFYHNISIVGTSAQCTVRTSYREAADLARLWPKQNHLLLGIMLLAFFVLFVNLGVFFIMVPQLLNMFFGIETVFDENSFAWNNSSFYLDVATFCFLILNPLNKAIYALRCFYGRARLSGADLKTALRSHQRARSAPTPLRAFALMLVLALLATDGRAAADAEAASVAAANVPVEADPSAAKLDQAIQKTLQKDEFSWRLPRTAPSKEDDGWTQRMWRSVLHFIKQVLRTPYQWAKKFTKWLLGSDQERNASAGSWWQTFRQIPWKLLVVLLAVIVVLLLLYWLYQSSRRGASRGTTAVATETARTVDLEAEDVRADELPEDSWLALAQQMIDRGEMRLALRAFYLATLSGLAQKQLVRLGAAKSNRDYLLELTRRLRGDTSFLGFFRENIRLFEASWYGTHGVTTAMIDTMRANHQQMRGHAAS